MSAPGTIQARVDVLTLAVSDLPRALAFYRDGLGLPSEGIVGEWNPRMLLDGAS